MFKFNDVDTRIFEYSKGERKEDGSFKNIFADPAAIKRQIDICMPNRNQLVGQYLAGEAVKRRKALEAAEHEKARQADPNLPEKVIEYSDDDNATVRMAGIAHNKLCNGIRDAFQLLPFDPLTGQGCTDYMAIAVLNHYEDWLEKKDGSTQASSTSSAPASAT